MEAVLSVPALKGGTGSVERVNPLTPYTSHKAEGGKTTYKCGGRNRSGGCRRTTYFLPLAFQQLAAVKTGGFDQENQQHDGKRRHLRQRGVDERSQ